MRKVVGYTQTLELLINLQPDHRRLAGRGLERRPRPSAGGPQGRLAAPRKKKRIAVLVRIKRVQLQLNDISISFVKRKKYPASSSGFRAVLRAGATGPTQGRGGPPNPAAAGDKL